jgi:hypothetical protein
VKINWPIRAQPVINGPATANKIGLSIKNPIIVNLYQTGALPKKIID